MTLYTVDYRTLLAEATVHSYSGFNKSCLFPLFLLLQISVWLLDVISRKWSWSSHRFLAILGTQEWQCRSVGWLDPHWMDCHEIEIEIDTHAAKRVNPNDFGYSLSSVKLFTLKYLYIYHVDWHKFWKRHPWFPDDKSYCLWRSPDVSSGTIMIYLSLVFFTMNITSQSCWSGCRHDVKANCLLLFSRQMHSKVLTLTLVEMTFSKAGSYHFKSWSIVFRSFSALLHSLSYTVLTSCPPYHHWGVWPHHTDSRRGLSDSLDPPESLRMECWQYHSHHTPGPLLYAGHRLCKRSDKKDWNYTAI